MWRWSDAELNWVSTNILLKPALILFESGMSTKRYFEAKGTAGLDRAAVRGYRRVPFPPPIITVNTFCAFVIIM